MKILTMKELRGGCIHYACLLESKEEERVYDLALSEDGWAKILEDLIFSAGINDDVMVSSDGDIIYYYRRGDNVPEVGERGEVFDGVIMERLK